MKISVILSLCAMLPATASAQLLTFGFQGAVPVQTPLGQGNNTMPFALGPTVTLRVLRGLSLESGVLFHRLGNTDSNFAFQSPESSFTFGMDHRRGRAIELPFLLKYQFLG